MPTTSTQILSRPHTLPGRAIPSVLVVYESAWGNTRRVAVAVAEGLRTTASTDVVDVASAPPVDDVHVDLLVIGAPTHAFGLSRPATRADASERGGATLPTGVREWLDAGTGRAAGLAATFDTHVRHPNLPGTASRVAARRLRHLGYVLAAGPEIFWVEGTEGPLLEGELDRARTWGAELARRA